ncbi:MAG: DNA-binding domain-containing protein [Thermoanaerobaculia bacterium]
MQPAPDLRRLPLDRLQHWMQAVIETPGDAEEAVASPVAAKIVPPDRVGDVVLPSNRLSSVERVGVYQGMYILRMVEALQGDYPAVAHFLGDHQFEHVVEDYAMAHPSTHYSFNSFGRRFPEFVRNSPRIRHKAFVYDLARLELAVTKVFDAPESPRLEPEDAAKISEEAWPNARLVPIEAFRVLAFDHPVNAYLQSVKQGSEEHPEVRRKHTWVAVWRKNYEVWRLDLGRPAYELLHALAKGKPFGKAVAASARKLQGNAGEQLFRWLRDWVAEGMFQGVDKTAR